VSGTFWSLPLATLTVVGSDALSWLNGLLTQELAVPGSNAPSSGDKGALLAAIPSFLLTKQGKIRASLVVVPEPSRVTLGVLGLSDKGRSQEGTPRQGSAAEALLQELDHYLVMEDAEIAVDTEARWFVGQVGSGVSGALGPNEFVASFPLLGPEAVWTLARGRSAVTLEAESSRSKVDFDALRLKWGFPWFGVDYGDGENPHEAGLDQTYVSFSKGCYLGQEVVCMQEMRGKVKRRVVRLAADSPSAELQVGTPVTTEAGETIGSVTTARGPHALAMVKAPLDAEGSIVRVADARASVAALRPGSLWAP
jgi:tRNA-modifying protein YgfZ